MCQPEGFVKKENEHLVCKLKKGLYGLKKSGRVWHHTLKQEMEKIGFKPDDADLTVYFCFKDNGSIKNCRMVC